MRRLEVLWSECNLQSYECVIQTSERCFGDAPACLAQCSALQPQPASWLSLGDHAAASSSFGLRLCQARLCAVKIRS